MGWNFRRSVNLGPLRINASKSGIGYSIGGRGFRIGKDSKGRTYTAASLPGTGIYRRDYQKKPPTQVLPSQIPQTRPAPAISVGQTSNKLAWVLYVVGAILLYAAIRFVFH